MRYINKKDEPKSAFEEQTGIPLEPSAKTKVATEKLPTKKFVSLDYRIAIFQGASGYYTVNVGTKKRAGDLEKSSEFIKWGTEWSFVNVN